MARAVTADHVLFDECIEEFRPQEARQLRRENPETVSHILTSFELPDRWTLPNCSIHRSIQVQLPGANVAFVCKVSNPKWVEMHNPHLYGLALASVVSFASGRPCKAPRDGYRNQEQLKPDQLLEIAISHPVLVAGPGASHPQLSASRLTAFAKFTSRLMQALYDAPYEKYVALMQAIRLVQLSLLARRDDFGLAYLLIVSAIESIAQIAVGRSDVRKVHASETEWESAARDNPTVKQILAAYRSIRGENQYAKERYVQFIKRFAPPEEWEDMVPHPMQDLVEYIEEIRPGQDMGWLTRKAWYEAYPADLPPEFLDTILSDSYGHRSAFIHRGVQPPHRDPAARNRFFQEVHSWDEQGLAVYLLPNYELLLGIAQRSISEWMTRET